MDINNILNSKEKSIGFSVVQYGTKVHLIWGGSSLAEFCVDDFSQEELKEKVHDFLGLNEKIILLLIPRMDEMYEDIIRHIKNEFCYDCNKSCKIPCKFILPIVEEVFRSKWIDYSSKN